MFEADMAVSFGELGMTAAVTALLFCACMFMILVLSAPLPSDATSLKKVQMHSIRVIAASWDMSRDFLSKAVGTGL